MKTRGVKMESLDRISFDIPHSLLVEFQQLAKKEGHSNMYNFWSEWMPRLRDMIRDRALTEAFAEDCVDKLRLRDEGVS